MTCFCGGTNLSPLLTAFLSTSAFDLLGQNSPRQRALSQTLQREYPRGRSRGPQPQRDPGNCLDILLTAHDPFEESSALLQVPGGGEHMGLGNGLLFLLRLLSGKAPEPNPIGGFSFSTPWGTPI